MSVTEGLHSGAPCDVTKKDCLELLLLSSLELGCKGQLDVHLKQIVYDIATLYNFRFQKVKASCHTMFMSSVE